jgi:hypothetical protein
MLMRPKNRCGTRSFTKARVKYKVHYDGKWHHERFKLPVTSCLH